jgi:hypothetical protein
MSIRINFHKRKIQNRIFIIIISVLLFGFVFPKIIDVFFSISGISLTTIQNIPAPDYLIFWGSLFGLASTLILAFVTLEQNDRLMKLEESKLQPLIIVEGIEISYKEFEVINPKEDSLTYIKFFYDDSSPNMEMSFNIKNISSQYISKIVISEFQILGFVFDKDHTTQDFVNYKKPARSLLDKGLVPGETKKIEICYEQKGDIRYYDMCAVFMKCELFYLVGDGSTVQLLNFQIINDNQRFYIIGTGSYTDKNIEDISKTIYQKKENNLNVEKKP